MTQPDLEPDPELVNQLQRIYGFSETEAREFASDPELAAEARSFVEGKIARDAALQQMDTAFERLRNALAQSAGRR